MKKNSTIPILKVSSNLEDRFWQKIEKIPFDDCWHWIGTVQYGYGIIREEKHGPSLKAHRVSLVIHGIKLINGLVVDHICRNKLCVNPKHLRQVTHRINSIENSIGPPALNNTKTHCLNGHLMDRVTKNKKWGDKRWCSICKTNRTAKRTAKGYFKKFYQNHKERWDKYK